MLENQFKFNRNCLVFYFIYSYTKAYALILNVYDGLNFAQCG